jgi:hypothetical protein
MLETNPSAGDTSDSDFSIVRYASPTTFQLDLVGTIPLPANNGWDVQHWTSASTFGMAWTLDSTVYYMPELGQAVQSFAMPPSSDPVPPLDPYLPSQIKVWRQAESDSSVVSQS